MYIAIFATGRSEMRFKMENLILDAFFENVPWQFKETDVNQVERESVEIPEAFLMEFPEMAGLLMVSNKFRIKLKDGRLYILYGWDLENGAGGWLCEPPEADEDSVRPESCRLLRRVFGNIVETFGFEDIREDLFCNMNWVLGTDAVQCGIGEWENYYEETCLAENKRGILEESTGCKKHPGIKPEDYIVIAEEANGNLTLCHKTTEQVLLFAPDHCFDYVSVCDGCPEYTFYTINGVETVKDYFETAAKQWGRYVGV